MNKTPIIIVVVIIIIVICCCSLGALLWTLGAWQMANEPYQYEGDSTGMDLSYCTIKEGSGYVATADISINQRPETYL